MIVLVFGLPALVVWALGLEGDARFIVYVVGAFGLLVTFVIGALAFALSRTRTLDPAFAAIGLVGRSPVPNVRHYTGTRGGRGVFGTYVRRGGVLEHGVAHTTGATAAFTRQETVGQAREMIGTTPPHGSSTSPRCFTYQAASSFGSPLALKKTPPMPVTFAMPATVPQTALDESARFARTRPSLIPG